LVRSPPPCSIKNAPRFVSLRSAQARKIALDVLEELADIKNIDHLAEQKAAFGVGGMLQLAQTDNKLIKKLACESIAEDVWAHEGKKGEIRELGGCEVLVGIVGDKNNDDEVLLPALWAVRNIAHGSAENKKELGRLGSIKILVDICEAVKAGSGIGNSNEREPIMESALTALVNLVVDDETNCRKLLKFGLDALIDIAEEYGGGPQSKGGGGESQKQSNGALATSLLVMLGPYNFLVCANCGKEQPGGTSCMQCGHAISFAS